MRYRLACARGAAKLRLEPLWAPFCCETLPSATRPRGHRRWAGASVTRTVLDFPDAETARPCPRGHCAPKMIFHNQDARLRVRQQGQMFRRRKFVVERHHYTAAVEHRICRNQPFRLIGHNDRGAVTTAANPAILESAASQRSSARHVAKLAVGQPAAFSPVAVRFDQANFRRKTFPAVSAAASAAPSDSYWVRSSTTLAYRAARA